MTRAGHAIGDHVALLMHVEAKTLGDSTPYGPPTPVDVIVTAVHKLGDGRTRYQARVPRLVEWTSG